ncbi:N-6 DNA methylase [Amycolatopsis sp. NPDC058278]|uniref:N-6 DNA methylase n=1 Tax=Amycolatopsis sp. NPDC058278 TaxID=3346417 RepID=UPI0036DE269B
MPIGDDNLQLVSLADIAELTQLTRPAISNWRRRHDDFPQPVQETGAVSLFRLADVQAWLTKHDKKQIEFTARQEVWRALSVVRGYVTVTRAVEVCLWVLGMYVLNAELDEDGRLWPSGRYGTDPADLLDAAADVAGEYLLGKPLELDPGEASKAAPLVGELPRLVREYGAAEVCEALIAEASERQGKGSGQYVTPAALAQLMIALANPLTGTVYDFACGWGNVLMHAHWNRSPDTALHLNGDDNLPIAWMIAALRMLIHGADGTIGNQNATTTHTSRNADFVFTDPPFGGQADTWTWLHRTIHHLGETGRGFHLTPMGPLFWSARGALNRRQLVKQGSVEAVITLPAGLYPHTAIPMALWLLRPPGKPRSTVLLVNGSNLGTPKRSQRELTSADIEKIVECHQAWKHDDQRTPEGGLPCQAVSIEKLLQGECRLDAAHWTSPETTSDVHASRIRSAHAKARDTTAQVPPVPALGALRPVQTQSVLVRDLGEVVRGIRVPQDRLGLGSTPLIQAKDIQRDWTALPSSTVDHEQLGRDLPRTRPGDVLVFAHDGQVRAGVDEAGGAVVAAPLQVVRLQEQTGDRALLLAVLLSGTPISASATLSYADIRDLTVAWPPVRDSAQVTSVLRSVIAQRDAVQKAATAANELLDAMVAAMAAGLHPGEAEDFR